MSSLSGLRQRIATVATIKKTTHAMRLIAMSNHARLRGDLERLRQYTSDVETIGVPATSGHSTQDNTRRVFVIVGSEKGLCGSFNTTLFEYCSREIFPQVSTDSVFISVGKQVREHLEEKGIPRIAQYEPLSLATFKEHARNLAQRIMIDHVHDRIVFVFNESKTFFVRTVSMRDYRVDFFSAHQAGDSSVEGDVQALGEYRERLRLQSFILRCFGESLIAEQAARFMSMDLSTRNAEALLEGMRLDYNKMRQALITRELTDLTSAL